MRGPNPAALLFLFWLRTAPRNNQPPTVRRQPPPTAHRQPPPTATHPPPTHVDHEAESVPVKLRFCWRCEPSSFVPPFEDSPAPGVAPVLRSVPTQSAGAAPVRHGEHPQVHGGGLVRPPERRRLRARDPADHPRGGRHHAARGPLPSEAVRQQLPLAEGGALLEDLRRQADVGGVRVGAAGGGGAKGPVAGGGGARRTACPKGNAARRDDRSMAGERAAKTATRPPQQPARPRDTNHWAPLTRKQHQQEHRGRQNAGDPTQHAKGRTGDCPSPTECHAGGRVVGGGGLVIDQRGFGWQLLVSSSNLYSPVEPPTIPCPL